jgi:hypothetical protein
MRLSLLMLGVCALATGCSRPEEDTPEPHWAFVPPEYSGGPVLEPARVGSAIQGSLPLLLSVEPTDLDPLLDTLAEALEGCGMDYVDYEEDETWYRFWFDGVCDDAGVEGFSYQFYSPLDPVYNAGSTGIATYTFWNGRAWTGALQLEGTAYWGWQDALLPDGTSVQVSWFDGQLGLEGGELPSWFASGAPSVYQSRSTSPEGVVTLLLDGSTPLQEPDVDAVHLSELSVVDDCVEVSGHVSVHARGGGWYELELLGGSGCEACGSVKDADGVFLGSTCLDVQPLLALGGA